MASNSRRVRFVSATLGISIIELVIMLWISCNLATLAFSQQNFYTQARYGKRGEDNIRDPFLSGSRYGRSGLVNMKNSKTVPKVLEILPRVDRFFTGPRFGKRAHTESQNEASLKSFEAALNYLDRMQHIELIKRDDSINYDKSNENNGNEEKKETKQNQVLCQMFHTSRC